MGKKESQSPHFHRPSHQGNGEKISFRQLIEEFDLKPNKQLGQHWLISEKAIRQIVDKSNGLFGVLEIGPGPGVLTHHLNSFAKVIAFDLDERMIAAASHYAPGAEIRLQDALTADWKATLNELPSPKGIVSNMPYNITGPLLDKVSQVQPLIDRAVLMMQREVGEKLLAEPGNRARGALSVIFQWQFNIQKLCIVPPGAFMPPPKVDSIVLIFKPRNPIEPPMAKIIRASFTQPRKTLVNNLSSAYDKCKISTALVELGLSESIRPHELNEESWLALIAKLI